MKSKIVILIMVLIAATNVTPLAEAPATREEFDDYTGIAAYENITVTEGYVAPITLYNESNLNGTEYGPGYTIINDGDQVYLWDEGYTTNATTLIGNLTTTAGSNYYEYEFYLDNDQEEENPTEIYDDDETFWTGNSWGGVGTIGDPVITEELIEVMRGTSSANITIPAGANNRWRVFHTYGGNQDWSAEDFICFYWYGLNSGNHIGVRIYAPNAGNRYHLNFLETWNGWRRIVLPLNLIPVEAGAPSWATVTEIGIGFYNQDNVIGERYLDRTVVDVGQWVNIEARVPNNMTLWTSTNYDDVKWELKTWDGGAYSNARYNDLTNIYFSGNGIHLLDTTHISEVYGVNSWQDQFFGSWAYNGTRGETKAIPRAQAGSNNITYSERYGAINRIGFNIKMPPDDGQDSSTTGISQIRFQFKIYYDGTPDGLTTFEYETGELYSVNILDGLDAILTDTLSYATLIQPNASIEIQFSQDNTTWIDHNGIAEAWDTLENETGTISLSGLNWAGNLYYRVRMTTGSTPRLLYLDQQYDVNQSEMIAGAITIGIFFILSLVTFIGMIIAESLVVSVSAAVVSFVCWAVTALYYLYLNSAFPGPGVLFMLFAAISLIYAVYAGLQLINPYRREELDDIS